LSTVHGSVLASGLFEEASIKTRAIEFSHHQTDLSNSPFICITLKTLYGRDHQQRKALTKIVLDNTYEIIQSPILLYVEVIDIDKVGYKRKEKRD
jgi:5-carboxymethyl-2-hydroxymuconate isomerase